MTFGKVFRQLRQERNRSLESVAGDFVSVSQVSRFERGEAEVTVSKFKKMLQQLELTLSEFELISQQYELDTTSQELQALIQMHIHSDTQGLKSLLKKKEQRASNTTADQLAYLLTKAALAKNDVDYSFSTVEKEAITEYLLHLSGWDYYHLSLLNSVLPILTTGSISLLAKELITRFSYYKKIPQHRKLIIRILLQATAHVLKEEKISQASYFLKTAQMWLDEDERDLYEKNLFLFVEGMFLFITDDQPTGETQMKESIHIFKLLGSDQLVQAFEHHFHKICIEKAFLPSWSET